MTMLRATLDRFEIDTAGQAIAVLVFDDGQQLVVPRSLLPAGVRHGSVLQIQFVLDADAEAQRRAEIATLQERLFGGASSSA